MSYKEIKIDIRDDHLPVLILASPKVLNAISPKALEWGLINQICEDDELLPKTLELGQNLGAGPTVSLGLIRQSYWQSADNTHTEQLHLESEFQNICGASYDALEGRTAFLEKREPEFKGK